MNMKKLYVMQWLPASGKSTKAKEIIENSKENSIIRVNRDLLREMLHFWKYSTLNEREVMNSEKILTEYFLKFWFDVIVDDTNLKQKNLDMWNDVARLLKVDLEIIKMNTPLSLCLERDENRPNKVGKDVILSMIEHNITVDSH